MLGEGATLGVAATIVGEAAPKILYNADEVFPTASVIKIAIVSELYTQVAEGHLALETPRTIGADNLVGGSGVLAQLTPGVTLTLKDLALLTIMVSDNTASNLCLAAVGGPEVVNRRMRTAWGMNDTTIHRPIKFHLTEGDPPHTATSTPRDMCQMVARLATGRVHSPETSKAVVDLMRTVRDTDMLARHLEVNAYAGDLEMNRPAFTIAHKPGAVNGVRNEAGIIRHAASGRELAICVYTQGVKDSRWTVENRGAHAVAEVSRLLCERLFS